MHRYIYRLTSSKSFLVIWGRKSRHLFVLHTILFLMNLNIAWIAFKYATDIAQLSSEKSRYARNLVKYVSNLYQTNCVWKAYKGHSGKIFLSIFQIIEWVCIILRIRRVGSGNPNNRISLHIYIIFDDFYLFFLDLAFIILWQEIVQNNLSGRIKMCNAFKRR